jgi:hypothetical protein
MAALGAAYLGATRARATGQVVSELNQLHSGTQAAGMASRFRFATLQHWIN